MCNSRIGKKQIISHQILKEYRAALVIREKRIDDLYNEIKIIKRLKVWVYKKVCFKKTSYGIFILS